MARIPYVNQADLAEADQPLLKRPINISRMLANSPDGLRAFGKPGTFIRIGMKLDERLRELAILQVGYVVRSAYEWTHHIKIALRSNVSEDDIRALVDDSAGKPTSLDPVTKLVLQGAREMTTGVAMSDATFAALREHMTPEILTELVITISYYNAVVKFLETMQVDVEDDYKQYLEKFPF